MPAGATDAGMDGGGPVFVDTVKTSFEASRDPIQCGNDPDCRAGVHLAVSASEVFLILDCPSGTGTVPLGDLNALVCNGSPGSATGGPYTCAPLVGTLTVRAINVPRPIPSGQWCSGKDCGHLEADLVAPAVSGEAAPFVSGKAQLLYNEAPDLVSMCGGGLSDG
jgi:hypothetical protein